MAGAAQAIPPFRQGAKRHRSSNPKNAGELSIRHFGNMNAAEAALGMDLDGVDGASPFSGPLSVVFGNVDGGAADFALVFVGAPNLTSSDFIF